MIVFSLWAIVTTVQSAKWVRNVSWMMESVLQADQGYMETRTIRIGSFSNTFNVDANQIQVPPPPPLCTTIVPNLWEGWCSLWIRTKNGVYALRLLCMVYKKNAVNRACTSMCEWQYPVYYLTLGRCMVSVQCGQPCAHMSHVHTATAQEVITSYYKS